MKNSANISDIDVGEKRENEVKNYAMKESKSEQRN